MQGINLASLPAVPPANTHGDTWWEKIGDALIPFDHYPCIFQIVNCTTRPISIYTYNQSDGLLALQTYKWKDMPVGRAADAACLARARPFFGKVWIFNDLSPSEQKFLRVDDGTRYFVIQVGPHDVHRCPSASVQFKGIETQLVARVSSTG